MLDPIVNKSSFPTNFILAAASIVCLGLSQRSEAAVTWLASDNGSDLTLSTDGGSLSFVLPSPAGNFQGGGLISVGSSHISFTGFPVVTESKLYRSVGTFSGNDPVISTVSLAATSGSGDYFGANGRHLLLPVGTPTGAGSITPVTTMTFAGVTIADAFGSNLDAGPVLLWTASTGGTNTISIALNSVPEPSSTALIALGGLGLIRRRRPVRS